MLPTFLPQTGELLTFDNSFNNMELLPETAATPDAGFADLLQLRLDGLPTLELNAGDVLPPDGNALPLEPDTVPPPADWLTPTAPVIQQGSPAQPSPEIALQGTEVQLSSGEPVDVPVASELQQAADAVEAPVPITAERAAQTVTDSVRAAARERLQEAEPTRQVTPVATRTPAAVEAINHDGIDVEAPVIRPLAESRVEPARRIDLSDTPDGVSRDARTAAPRDSLTQLIPAVTPSQARGDGLQDDAGSRPQNMQQLMQNFSQAFATQAQSAQVGPTMATVAQPPATEMAAGTLPAQATLIDTPVADSAWGDRLGERVLLMAGNQLRNAEIRLTPAELGPVRVQVTVDDGTANITFHAQHAMTRDAIEQALPRLREMLVENGLSLGQASVGEQGVAGQENASRDGADDLVSFGAEGEEATMQTTTDGTAADTRIRATNGIVDTFV